MLNSRVQTFELPSGVVDLKSPVDAALLCVGFLGPGGDLRTEERQVADAPSGQALAGETAEFTLGDVQPTPARSISASHKGYAFFIAQVRQSRSES